MRRRLMIAAAVAAGAVLTVAGIAVTLMVLYALFWHIAMRG